MKNVRQHRLVHYAALSTGSGSVNRSTSDKVQDRPRYGRYADFLSWVLFFTLVLFGEVVSDEHSERHRVVNGVEVFLGIVPSELFLRRPIDHPEAEMHGGVPEDLLHYHVMVAIFEHQTGDRISNAMVHASIVGPEGAGLVKPLESMVTTGVISYGNFFVVPDSGPFRIRIVIRRPNVKDAIETEFEIRQAVASVQ